MRIGLALIAVLAMASAASAVDPFVVSAYAVDLGVDNSLGYPVQGYDVYVMTSSPGHQISALDLNVSGVLSQAWLAGPTKSTFNVAWLAGLGYAFVDTHFAPAAGVEPAGFESDEDNDLSGPTVVGTAGWGTFLVNGIATLGGAGNPIGTDVMVAHLAIQPGSVARVYGQVGSELGGVTADVDFTIPEPVTMTLLAVGGLALLKRRRS